MKTYHKTSGKTDWETPQYFFDQINNLFGPFDIDVCASKDNAKCPIYFSIDDDALTIPWQGNRCFCNPPYGSQLSKWVRKAYAESLSGACVVMVLPARTDTSWFHRYCSKSQCFFIKGRLSFSNSSGRSPFPTMVCVFGTFNRFGNRLASFLTPSDWLPANFSV